MTERHSFWRVYATAFTLYAITAYALRPFTHDIDYLDAFIVAPSIIGLWGFAYNSRIWNRWVWRVYAPFQVGWDLWYLLSLNPVSDILAAWDGVLIGYAITTPLYIALFWYGWAHSPWEDPDPVDPPSRPSDTF